MVSGLDVLREMWESGSSCSYDTGSVFGGNCCGEDSVDVIGFVFVSDAIFEGIRDFVARMSGIECNCFEICKDIGVY